MKLSVTIILLVILFSDFTSAQFGFGNVVPKPPASIPAVPKPPVSIPAVPTPKIPFTDLTLPKNFDPLDVNKFVGFNASAFDGQPFNPFDFAIDNIFDRFIKRFGRNYSEAEKPKRKENLFNAIRKIAEHIVKSVSSGNVPNIQLGLTELSDYTDAEYKSTLGFRLVSNADGLPRIIRKRAAAKNSDNCKPKSDASVVKQKKSYDLRDFGFVPPVRNQKTCGSCWVFSSVATLETQWARKNNKKIFDLSEQDLLNCVEVPGGLGGCKGGDPRFIYNFVKQNGTSLETSGPYINKKAACKKSRDRTEVQLTEFCLKGKRTDEKIMLDIFSFGAVVVSIDANDMDIYQNYRGGVLDIPKLADSKKVNHAVVIVGWGTEDGKDYWIVRNSYGKDWGIDGYLLIARNKNMCGINTSCFYPIIN